MVNKRKSQIQIKRGSKNTLSLLKEGEFGLTLDSQELFLGDGKKNKRIPFEEIDIWYPEVSGLIVEGSHTYDKNVGIYVRTGNLIKVYFNILLSLKDVNMQGDIVISGLPFVSNENINIEYHDVNFGITNLQLNLTGYVPIGSNVIVLDKLNEQFIIDTVKSEDIKDNTEICGSATYII